MANVSYSLVYEGELTLGRDPLEVEYNLVTFFKLPQQKVKALIDRGHGTLKRNLTLPAAEYMQMVFAEVGLKVEIYHRTLANEAQPARGTKASKPSPKRATAIPLHPHRAAKQQAKARLYPHLFTFTGSGSEYFRIWFVNLLLTLVTLGLFSPWAKVRSDHYFYANTWLDGHKFTYHADPWELMREWSTPTLAALLWLNIYLCHPMVAPLLAVAMLPIIPWLVVYSMRSRAKNSTYRYVQFHFDGGYRDALGPFLLWPVLALLSLGLLLPVAIYRQNAFLIGQSRFGKVRFSFNATLRHYYRLYLPPVLLVLTLAGALGYLYLQLPAPLSPQLRLLLPPGLVLGALLLVTYLGAAGANLRYAGLSVEKQSFISRQRPLQLFVHRLKYLLLMLTTLGLAYPWLRVARARLRAESLALMAGQGFKEFIEQQENMGQAPTSPEFELFTFSNAA